MRLTLFLSVFVFACFNGKTQSSADSALLKKQMAAATVTYYQSLKTQSGIYNGSEYVQYAHLLKEGFPYFDTTVLANGRLCYDGMEYQDVPMLYDLVKDELVAQHFNKVFLIQLVKSKVKWFQLHQHYFVHLTGDSMTNTPRRLRDGFYDLAYDGSKIKLYIKRVKEIQESIPDNKVERKIYQNDRYFIYKDSIYYDVKSHGSILKVLNRFQAEQRKAVKSQKIRFRKNREAALLIMVKKFDQLSRQQ